MADGIVSAGREKYGATLLSNMGDKCHL
ncbi:hypothetical protein J3R73_000981 [Labrys monachus]|uniref:Uncharacterized protein n=1 Tax=Labrys monachus TaxID=217067 RepID=A0ABU0F9B1_9HYPH|nr:hypothetical protein [Labrys monachus]